MFLTSFIFSSSAPYPALVVKASGLAAGKGVVVASTKEEACQAVDDILTDAKYGSAGETVVIEEVLEGDEVSVSMFCRSEFWRVCRKVRYWVH